MGWRFNPISPCCGCDKAICFYDRGCCSSFPVGMRAEVRPAGSDPEDEPVGFCEPVYDPLTIGGQCCIDLTDQPEGDYDWRVSAPGYTTQTGTVTVMCGDNPTVVGVLCTADPIPTLILTDPAGNEITLDYVPGSATPCENSGSGSYTGAYTYDNVTPGFAWFDAHSDPPGLTCGRNYPPEVRPVTITYIYGCGSLSYAVPTYCYSGFDPDPCELIESPSEGMAIFCDNYGLTGFGHGGAETTDFSPCLPVTATWPYGGAIGSCCNRVFTGPIVVENTLLDAVFHPGGGSGGTFSIREP